MRTALCELRSRRNLALPLWLYSRRTESNLTYRREWTAVPLQHRVMLQAKASGPGIFSDGAANGCETRDMKESVWKEPESLTRGGGRFL